MCTILVGVVKKDFFEVGVDRQFNAWNLYQAQKQFEKSCYLCTMQCKQMDCDVCPIKLAFETNVELKKNTCSRYFYERVKRNLQEVEGR